MNRPDPTSAPRLLFLPVSGPAGTGEYVRCLTIARAALARWPQLDIGFGLSRHAPYLASVPFPVHPIDGSPTRHTAAVNNILERVRPHVAVFDNAGRTAQLACARNVGARTVFISRRPGKRRKGFRLRWLRLLDQHWIAFPTFIDGPLGAWERMKLRLFPGVEVVFLGAIFSESLPARRAELLRGLALTGRPYVLFSGGGGGSHPGGVSAPDVFAAAAAAVARQGGASVALVAGQSARPGAGDRAGVTVLPSVPPEHLIDLLHDAEIVVCNGGTTLTQALAHRRPCVAVAIADDQPRRVRRCAGLGLIVASPLEAAALGERVLALLRDPARRDELAARAAATGLDNGVERALAALARLLPVRASEEDDSHAFTIS
jgi:hypothetical protein